ncbi:hypothetical protein [Deinococcus hopiensis]|uniref:Uncharacterized protein n=1 Tax=Deinococcus hopiensis KR-140 TaxID=695939 RepID=A0A1W1UDQ7_9DEIO|nr:hypothetical protein [Deinococcus hopiensis]SMB79173.1 hypothetical protein SAMN00790413_05813 [Deinococcus hopiensis KR-140]
MTDSSATAPKIIAVTTLDGYLYAVSKAGYLLPLYFYGPILSHLDGGTTPPVFDVPFVDGWPPYTQPFAEGYVPVPKLNNKVLPDDIETFFTEQERSQSKRNWQQLVFGGYPLYIFGNGEQPDPVGSDVREHPTALFRQVKVDFRHGPITGVKDGPTMPPAYVGP